MAEKAKTKVETAAEDDADVARKIWLAGIGAYGRAFSEAQGQLTKVNEEAAKFFDDLVDRGQQMEDEVRDRLASNERVVKTLETVGDFSEKQRSTFETRMDRMREMVGAPFGFMSVGQRLEQLTQHIEDLSHDVAELKKEVKRTTGKSSSRTKKSA
ncbi:MAG: phasin family protein [Pseudomonadota bacterium]